MSEQNQHNNWPYKISPEVPEEMLRVLIPAIAPALVWIAQHRRMLGGSARVCRFFQGHKGRHQRRRLIEMMDVILQPDVQEVVIQKSTQIQDAKTSQNLVLDSFRVAADSESMTDRCAPLVVSDSVEVGRKKI